MDELREKISQFTYERPLLARITLIILVFFVIAMIIIFIQSSKPKQKQYEQTNIIIDSTPLYPAGPEIEKEYYQTRKKENTWSDDEIKKWFTETDQKLINELEKSNDKIINEVIGAAP